MEKQTSPQVIRITGDEWPDIAAQARAEHWDALTLIAPALEYVIPHLADANRTRVYVVFAGETDLLRHLATLDALSSLGLLGLGIGEAGARELARLSALTSLDINYNQIGAAGARERKRRQRFRTYARSLPPHWWKTKDCSMSVTISPRPTCE